MLATSTHQPFPFLPAIPSPLSPRSANIHGQRFITRNKTNPADPMSRSPLSSSSYAEAKKPSTSPTCVPAPGSQPSHIPFSQRPVKSAPIPRTDTLRANRRGAYLQKVQDARDERRFAVRGDDMMRLDFVQRQRAWEAEQARTATAMLGFRYEDDEEVEEEDEGPGEFGHGDVNGRSSQTLFASQASESLLPMPLYDEEVEEFLRNEDREMEALLGFVPGQEAEASSQDDHDSDGLWSDDVDYDELFSEMLEQKENVPATTQEMDSHMVDDGEEMDIT